MKKILGFNLEVTNECPLRCPQCYCNFDKIEYMNFETAKRWIDEASVHGIKNVALSGGETMCYLELLDVIRYAKTKGMKVAAAFSGWNFRDETVRELIATGIDNISISLNGSTEEINKLTRDGYGYAMNALELLKKYNYAHSCINWVMHSHNVNDFCRVVGIAEEYCVEMIDVISFKPDSKKQMKSVPTKQQLYDIAEYIREYKGAVKIVIENCYSQLRAITCDTKLFGNLNVGINRGCRAGISVFSVNVDGTLSPCRHIHNKEKFESIAEYFEKSEIISELRMCTEDNAKVPCAGCRYLKNCRPCMAINTEIENSVEFKNEFCPINDETVEMYV